MYIVGHAAPGSDSRHAYDMSPDANSKYLRTVREHSRVIAGQFFGHLHADTFRVIYDNGELIDYGFVLVVELTGEPPTTCHLTPIRSTCTRCGRTPGSSRGSFSGIYMRVINDNGELINGLRFIFQCWPQ